jgi:hypothetical protein
MKKLGGKFQNFNKISQIHTRKTEIFQEKSLFFFGKEQGTMSVFF